jgi:EAL domain-containing protein (putative c-di-GMP-specific phosphodiesterase class I)
LVREKIGFSSEEVATEVPPRADAGVKAVLVVDDDPAVSRALRRVLEAAGYEVTVESNGNAAIQTIMQRSFDVVLSDIQMPGMTGVELLGVVRAYDLDVPVILMTGEPTIETAIEAVALGAMQYLPKPTTKDILLRAVERASRMRRVASIARSPSVPVVEERAQDEDHAGLTLRLDSALEGMWMAFQPIVGRRDLFGYEALLRTEEPTFLQPQGILKVAEVLGRLSDVGRRARALSAEAFARAPADAQLFVNLHTRDLLDKDLYDAEAPLTRMANRVILEITERSAIDEIKDLQARIAVLRYHGFRVGIDDLGAGYAGLATFAAVAPDFVKLDMSLVRGIHLSEIRQRLVGAMATLCSEMGVRVVAEGVEVREEAQNVRALGCEFAQGYFFARPGEAFPAVMTFG